MAITCLVPRESGAHRSRSLAEGVGTHNQEAEVRLPDLDLPPVGKAALEKSLPFCQDGRGAQGSLPAESVHCSPSGGEGPSLLGEKRSVHDARATVEMAGTSQPDTGWTKLH